MHDHDADEVTRLLDRVGAGRPRPGDMERLRALVSVRGDGNRIQVGRHNIDISGGQDIRIGDHVYQGSDADTIALAISQVIGDPPPPPSRWFIAIVSLGFLICLAAFGVFGYTLFTDRPELQPGAGPQVPEGVVLAGAMFLTGFVIIVVASVVRAIVNPPQYRNSSAAGADLEVHMGAAEVAAILAPLIVPFARRAGSEAREQLAARIGGEASESVARLWERVRGRVTGGGGDTSEVAVESRLAEALEEDPILLEEARAAVSIVVQGDRNTVQQGGTNINISGGHDIRIGPLPD